MKSDVELLITLSTEVAFGLSRNSMFFPPEVSVACLKTELRLFISSMACDSVMGLLAPSYIGEVL